MFQSLFKQINSLCIISGGDFCLLFCSLVSANTDGPVKLGGRLFIDGGLFTQNSYSAHAKAEITDVRLTGKITLPDEWYTKIDVGFAGNKVSLKDAFVQKKWGNNNFRIGYMLGMCCIEQSASTNDYVFMTGANAAETFYLGRRVGVSYTFSQNKYYCSAGLFCGDGAEYDDKVLPGYNATLRGVFRPLNEAGKLLHLGVGGLFRRPDREKEQKDRLVTFSSNGVTGLSVPSVLDIEINNVKHTFQWNLEALYLSRCFFLKGNFFNYDEWDALPLTPKESKSLLLSGRINVTNLNDGPVKGGMQQDITVGLNYYMNKFLILKLNGSVVWTKDMEEVKKSFGVLQARLQVRF